MGPLTPDERKSVQSFIFAFFEAGKNKDIPALARFHGHRDVFTKFDENPPYTRQNADEAFIHEQAAFANISDYSYQIDDLRIDMMEGAALATFYLTYRGIFVNDYSFEGSPVGSKDRVTMLLVKGSEGWKIMHSHFSRFPDWDSRKAQTSAERA